jgi:hypothetical protein
MMTISMSSLSTDSPVRVDIPLPEALTFQEATRHLLGYFEKKTASVYDSCVLGQCARQAAPITAFHMYQLLQSIYDIPYVVDGVSNSAYLAQPEGLRVNFLEWLNLYNAAPALQRSEEVIFLKGELLRYFPI